jgi:hypothetical protein
MLNAQRVHKLGPIGSAIWQIKNNSPAFSFPKIHCGAVPNVLNPNPRSWEKLYTKRRVLANPGN